VQRAHGVVFDGLPLHLAMMRMLNGVLQTVSLLHLRKPVVVLLCCRWL
jgi:hypothetical protein